MTSLDVIARVKTEFGLPTAAYHVSGEYAMLKAAARNGWIDEPRALMGKPTSIRRAGPCARPHMTPPNFQSRASRAANSQTVLHRLEVGNCPRTKRAVLGVV